VAARTRRRKVLVVALVVLVALLAAGGVSAYSFMTRNDPAVYSNIVEQYKYGSVGTEELQGIPYEIWVVLPRSFPTCSRRVRGPAIGASGSSTSADTRLRSGRRTARSRSGSSA
jgi:hypothetical protein